MVGNSDGGVGGVAAERTEMARPRVKVNEGRRAW